MAHTIHFSCSRIRRFMPLAPVSRLKSKRIPLLFKLYRKTLQPNPSTSFTSLSLSPHLYVHIFIFWDEPKKHNQPPLKKNHLRSVPFSLTSSTVASSLLRFFASRLAGRLRLHVSAEGLGPRSGRSPGGFPRGRTCERRFRRRRVLFRWGDVRWREGSGFFRLPMFFGFFSEACTCR